VYGVQETHSLDLKLLLTFCRCSCCCWDAAVLVEGVQQLPPASSGGTSCRHNRSDYMKSVRWNNTSTSGLVAQHKFCWICIRCLNLFIMLLYAATMRRQFVTALQFTCLHADN